MRLWSLHPKYLDSKGLVAVWREALLAKNVLLGKTKGYVNHPQLTRFRNSEEPINCINLYLSNIYNESLVRGYVFDKSKFTIDLNLVTIPINVTSGQVEYEWLHLLNKLKKRERDKYEQIKSEKEIKLNSVFEMVQGPVEKWEKVGIKKKKRVIPASEFSLRSRFF